MLVNVCVLFHMCVVECSHENDKNCLLKRRWETTNSIDLSNVVVTYLERSLHRLWRMSVSVELKNNIQYSIQSLHGCLLSAVSFFFFCCLAFILFVFDFVCKQLQKSGFFFSFHSCVCVCIRASINAYCNKKKNIHIENQYCFEIKRKVENKGKTK